MANTVNQVTIAPGGKGLASDELEVKVLLRGTPEAVIVALAHGLPREALQAIHDALGAEMRRREPVRRGGAARMTEFPEDEGDRQLLLLALAICALDRPGFNDALSRIAAQIRGGPSMFEEFKRLNVDRWAASPPEPLFGWGDKREKSE